MDHLLGPARASTSLYLLVSNREFCQCKFLSMQDFEDLAASTSMFGLSQKGKNINVWHLFNIYGCVPAIDADTTNVILLSRKNNINLVL